MHGIEMIVCNINNVKYYSTLIISVYTDLVDKVFFNVI